MIKISKNTVLDTFEKLNIRVNIHVSHIPALVNRNMYKILYVYNFTFTLLSFLFFHT